MKTAELTGALLDYWVARAEGRTAPRIANRYPSGQVCYTQMANISNYPYAPSVNWSQGGPLIEKYNLDIDKIGPVQWLATDNGDIYGIGDTPLQAICRAVVRAAFGDEVEEVAVC